MKKSQISVIELPLAFLLFFLFSVNLIYSNNSDSNNTQISEYKNLINSNLNAIYYSNEFRKEIILENLSNLNITENWTNLGNFLNKSFQNYSLIISNGSINKKIFNCQAKYNKYYSERIIAIYNNSNYNFRKITLGVCY